MDIISSDNEPYPLNCFWLQLKSSNCNVRTRFKHAACYHANHVYLHGGKDASRPLKDLWRFDLKKEEWEEVLPQGTELGHLQGHTLTSYKRLILIFGGDFTNSFESAPLWIYNPDLNHMRRYVHEGTIQPSGRREHTSIIYNDKLYIYGGFDDVKGSSGEFWQFSIDEEEWSLLPQSTKDHPGKRHAHTACNHGNSMWIFGGMADLTLKNDLWQYNFGKWFQHRLLNGPPPLSGHTALTVGNNMLIIGGEKHGQIFQDIWSLHFDSLTWSKIEQDNRAALPPLTQHTSVIINGSRSQTTNQNIRTASVPQLQRKKIRASQHSLPDRPKSSPLHSSIHSTSVNFHNKIFPATSSLVQDFELQTVNSKANNSYSEIVNTPSLDEKPLLNQSFSNVSVGVDNCANDILLDECVAIKEPSKKEKSKLYFKKSEDVNFNVLCSECKSHHNFSQPSSRDKGIYRSNCAVCKRPLRRSRHECDITLEDLEHLDSEIMKHETLSNSFKDMHENQKYCENIELNDFSQQVNSGADNCDIISMCSRCHSSHVCCHGDNNEASFITCNVVSIATQTEERSYTATERKYLYSPVNDDADSGIDDENTSACFNKVDIIVFGGKSNTRKTVEMSPISVWKLEIPY